MDVAAAHLDDEEHGVHTGHAREPELHRQHAREERGHAGEQAQDQRNSDRDLT